jgi:type IV secretion system protein VirB4
MFKIKFKQQKNTFSSLLPWAYITDFAEGIVVQKDGLLQKTFVYRGPDLESSKGVYVNDMCLYLNDIIKSLGSGWALQFETRRNLTTNYPGSDFSNLAAYLVDKERENIYQNYGRHYTTAYFMTVIYEPPTETTNKLLHFFTTQKTGFEQTIKEAVEEIETVGNDMSEVLSKVMQIAPLNNEQTLNFLHASISFQPDLKLEKQLPPFYLDHVLPDEKLVNADPLILGDNYIPTLTIKTFPTDSYPAILDSLNAADCEYRWVTRIICMDKETAEKTIESNAAAWFGRRQSWRQALHKTLTNEDTGRENMAAVVQGNDTEEARIGIERDEYSLGYFSTSIMVWDTDKIQARKKITYLKGLIQSQGFTCCEERMNRMESFLSMQPGNVYANLRRSILTSLNFSHIIPSSAIWAGDLDNQHMREVLNIPDNKTIPPLIVCSTGYSAPFFFNLNVGDVGNAFVVGPVGSGKSSLLQMIEIQFLKYRQIKTDEEGNTYYQDPQVFIIDKGRSARQLTMAVGGRYYEPGTTKVSFQPLEDLDSYEEKLWAQEWISLVLEIQPDIQMNSEKTKKIQTAIELMSDLPIEQRSLTTFQQLVEDQQIKNALSMYTLEGKYGEMFDSGETSLQSASWMMIEMGNLMERSGTAAVTPALEYIFHYFERHFDGTLTLLVIDEAFIFFRNEVFAKRFHEWLKTLRKLNVFVVFATQEVADIIKSPLCSTIIEQCMTKIYLANKEAGTPNIKDNYQELGVTDAEIELITRSTYKQDYFYKSPLGSRKYQLEIGKGSVTAGLLFNQDHKALDALEAEHTKIVNIATKKTKEGEPLSEIEQSHFIKNYSFAKAILDSKGIEYENLLEEI